MSAAEGLFEAAVGLRDRERSALCHLFAQQRNVSATFPDRRDTEALWASLVDVLHEAGVEARRRRQRLDEDFARVVGVTAVPLPGSMGASRTRAGYPPDLLGRSSAHDALDGEPRATDDPPTS